MRLFSITISVGPIGGAPVPSITVAPRSTRRLNGPRPRSRWVAAVTTGWPALERVAASSSPGRAASGICVSVISSSSAENFVRMLAQQRLAIKGLRRLVLEAHHRRQVLAAVVADDDGAALQEVRVLDRLGQRVDRAVADVERRQPVHPMGERLLP